MKETVNKESIERILSTPKCLLSDVEFGSIAAIGLIGDIYAKNFEALNGRINSIYPTYMNHPLIDLYDEPSVSKEEYHNLTTGKRVKRKIMIATDLRITVEGNTKCIPSRNLIQYLNNYWRMQPGEPDYGNIAYSFDVSKDAETSIWTTRKIIPIYKGNSDYEIIRKSALEE